jgi:hypothetical protein
MGDRACSEKWGVTTKTIERDRLRLDNDPIMSEFVAKYRVLQNEKWVNHIPAAIVAGLNFLEKSFNSLQPGDPRAIVAVAQAIQTLGELVLTFKVLDSRLHNSVDDRWLTKRETTKGQEDLRL